MPVVFTEMPMMTKFHIPGTLMQALCTNKTLEKGEDTCMGDWFPLVQTHKYFAGMSFRARMTLV